MSFPPEVRANPSDRCYYCKQQIFSTIIDTAARDGYSLILDGTNASDDASDRPGMRALKELKVRSPLRECGLTKAEIRRLSREAGLFTWDKPAYACLATRVAQGEEITAEKLEKTELAEGYLMRMGFSDLRVRQSSGDAVLQIRKDQSSLLEENHDEIINELKKYYNSVTIDLETRK